MAENGSIAVDVRGITMRFGPITALSNVSFEARRGEVLGLLGPNGAGKTTCMRILTTYLEPTEGDALVGSHSVRAQPLNVRRLVGYLPETSPLYGDMEVREYLAFVGRARGLEGVKLQARLDYVVETCSLQGVYARPLLELSKGYRQRVGFAQALIHDPEILILDEPTSGLDPLQILGVRELLRRLVKEGKTILFSSHILQEVLAVTDRIVVIGEGKILAKGTSEEIRRRAARRPLVVVTFEGTPDGVEQVLASVGPAKLAKENGRVTAQVEADPVSVFDALRKQEVKVRELREELPTLEDAFVQLIREAKQVEKVTS